jgi:hypothetical protein
MVIGPPLAAAGVVFVFASVALLAFRPHYETNDDVVMNLIAAGRAVTDAPNEHLAYSNVLIGLALKHLYQALPDVPWYGVYLFGTEAASLTAICYAFFSANFSGKQALAILAFMIVFALPCMAMIQFTTAAFLAAEAGLLLLIVDARSEKPAAKWLAIPLLVLASLIRWDACLLACVIFAPALATAFIRLAPMRIKWRCVILLAACLAAGWGFSGFNRWYYSGSEGWSDFYEFNRLRNQFIDYRRVEFNDRTKLTLDSVGWSAVDLEMLQHWGFANSQRFSKEKMRAVLDGVHLSDRESRNWHDFLEILSRREVLALLATGFGCMMLMGGSYRGRVVPILCLAIAMAVCVLLFEFYLLPRRVYFPAASAFIAVAIIGSIGGWPFSDLKSRSCARALRVGLLLLGAIMLGWRLVRDIELDSWHRQRHSEAIQMMATLAPRNDQLYVVWKSGMPWEHLVFPLERMWLPPELKVVGLSTMLPTPFTKDRCREFNIQDLDRALFTRPDVFLVSYPELNSLFKTYAAEHYAAAVSARVVFSHVGLGGSSVYKLSAMFPLSGARE